MPASLTISNSLEIPGDEIALSFSRSSGAGGQNVNKVNSKVTLRWSPSSTSVLSREQIARFLQRYSSRVTESGEIVISSSTHRDQPRNIEECYLKLASMISAILRPAKKRIATKPGRGMKEKRLSSKRKHAQKKENRRRNYSKD